MATTAGIGVIIGIRNADGSPPYIVNWLRDGHIALVFPEPYARIVTAETANAASELSERPN
jgi:Domain of unknown function (DUF1918)